MQPVVVSTNASGQQPQAIINAAFDSKCWTEYASQMITWYGVDLNKYDTYM